MHFLFMFLLQAVGAALLICPNKTVSSTTFFAFKVDLLYGEQNGTCTVEEEISVRDKINEALLYMNPTTPDGPTKALSGGICIDDEVHRNLVLINSFTWGGRATCKLCSTGRRLRRLEQENIAEEFAYLASRGLSNLITATYVNDTGSCLYQAWATAVVVTVTEMTQTPEDPCV